MALLISLGSIPLISKTGLNPFIACPLSALIFGNGFFLITLVRSRVRLKLFWANVLVQSALMLLCILVCSAALFFLFGWMQWRGSPLAPAFLKAMQVQIGLLPLRVLLPLGFVLASLINAFFQFDRKLGPGVMWNWITGKYYNPREEVLIFMFLDLKNSTSLAEQLGPLKFSALVRDFFRDMTLPVLESKGSVSHYIGDEAVIYWKPKAGLDSARCLRMFFDFQRVLVAREGFYAATYGALPRFKAAAHLGPVVATEVGEIKSEIVFHGDTLNTAARLQGLCNELGESLLISAELQARLEADTDLHMEDVGTHLLKGKAQPMNVFAVRSVAES